LAARDFGCAKAGVFFFTPSAVDRGGLQQVMRCSRGAALPCGPACEKSVRARPMHGGAFLARVDDSIARHG
jgi:hypothetical protein